ncbi:DinB family protein [Leeuwenhoekiella sp. A16]|uniref:DinB family protein n=1 Tax=unclassified Leeuwenhoekiella TaxID=2615029 RepID=UPI003A80501F
MTDNVNSLPEVWLRGKLPEIPALLQPAAHALKQAVEDMYKYTADFPPELLWEKPAGRASVGFHLQHLTGVLDRMLTYAAGENLSENQFDYLKKEGKIVDVSVDQLVDAFAEKVKEALAKFKTVPEAILMEERTVGRIKLPSTVIGLLFHAAEHSQRHIGQMLVTISVVKNR